MLHSAIASDLAVSSSAVVGILPHLPAASHHIAVGGAVPADRLCPIAKMAASVICPQTVSRVSSVLNREVKQFGKKYMFDGNAETCWNSDQGSIQWLMLEFPHTVKVSQVQIQFQGGFASRKCTLHGCSKGEELSQITEVYPEDTNSLQRFSLTEALLDKLKITFEDSTDFFGRIIIYHLDVLGEKL